MVDTVDASVCQSAMHVGFDAECVVGEGQSVHADLKGSDALLSSRIRSMGSSLRVNLILTTPSPKAPMLGNDAHVADADVRGA